MGLDNPIHIAFLLIMMLLVFGAKRLPEMGRSLGSGMRGFRDAISGESPLPAPEIPEVGAIAEVRDGAAPAEAPAPAARAAVFPPAGESRTAA